MSKNIIREVKNWERFVEIVESMPVPVLMSYSLGRYSIKLRFINENGVCEYHYEVRYPSSIDKIKIARFVRRYYEREEFEMKTKLLFLDTETTGLDPNKHGVIQVAMIADHGMLDLQVNPGKKVEYDKEALKINGIKKKKIKKFPASTPQFNKMLDFLGEGVNKYDKKDKYVAVGYNVKFDVEMLHGWARREGYEYLGSFIDWRVIDVLVLARLAHYLGQMPSEPEDFKLGTICQVYDMPVPDHDAMTDVMATRILFEKIIKEWKCEIPF